MSTRSRFTYTVVGSVGDQWFPIATDLKKDEAIGIIRTWVYGAVRYTYSHPDTAATESQPWWVKARRSNSRAPESTKEFLSLSPWFVTIVRHVDSCLAKQIDDPKRVVESWMVGPVSNADNETDRTMHGWHGLKLRPQYPWEPIDTWACMLLDEKVYATASATQDNIGSNRLFKSCVVVNQRVHDIGYGAEHVRRRLR